MTSKDIQDMSNSDLRVYQENLRNEYEVVKKQISDGFKKLDDMDKEYIKIENELKSRMSR